MKLKFFVAVGLFLTLVACGPTAVSPETETASRPTAIATAVAQLTETPTQMATAVSTTLPTQTPLPVLTPEPFPAPQIEASMTSPDGKWLETVETGFFDSEEKQIILRITNLEEGSELIAEKSSAVDPFYTVSPHLKFWSSDSQYLYFTHRSFGDGCGLNSDGDGLFRVDVGIGETEELSPHGSWFSFLPDETRIAYLSGNTIFIRDLISGVERKAILDITNEYEEVFLSDLVWSSDGLSIAVQVGINICLDLLNSQHAIILVNVETLSQTIILEDSKLRRIHEWPESNTLIVTLSEGGQSEVVRFKIDTAEFLPLETAVPQPTTFTPRFDRFLPFANPEGGSNSLTGLVRQGDGWQLARVPYPTGLYNEELGYALGTDSVDSDYAVATDRLLAWTFGGGAGPGNLAVGQLFIVNVATEEVEIVADNVVSAGWAPNGLDFAYILATPETYELRWRTAAGEDKLLAVDVPHTLKVSPDGRFVAFTRESWYEVDGTPPGLYVVEIETGIETQISPLDRAGYGGTGLYWKPDGSHVFLFATGNDDRAETPHEEGYAWAATDGSFQHFLPVSAFKAFFVGEPLSNSELVRCVGGPALFAANQIVLPVGECPAFGPANPETAQFAVFALDPQSGEVRLTAVLPTPNTAQLLTWDTPGESVFVLDEGEVTSVEIERVDIE
ncbi:MAG: hypothetical protein H6655_13295 [Ardenticatenaceae bacterium]|nr:hypothetical protein [Ardenticatenaceae bacterium]